MMETPNQNQPAPEQKQNQQNGGANRHHRHRGHRGGKHHHSGQKKEHATPLQNSSEAATQAPREEKPSNAEQSNRPSSTKGNNRPKGNTPNQQNNQSSEGKGGNRRNRNRNRNKHTSHGYFREAPERSSAEDELSLADLRAQIVLKAADGTIPAKEIKVAPANAPVNEPNAEKAKSTEVIEATLTAEEPAPVADAPLMPAPDIPTPVTNEVERIEVVGVRFRTSGKMYYFDPQKHRPQKGEFVIVETARGPEFGEVCLGNCNVNKKDVVLPLRPVIRIATKEDAVHNEENRQKEEKALDICREKIANHKLEMKLIDAQYAFDNSKLLFYFSAEGRVDFRDLVKDLASVFHTRIELRQIGIRDEARMLGGLGVCGRPLCCSTFLSDFAQVSIKMAKEQNLSLNSSKISGVCGRLMCCLHYEAEVYSEEIKKTPTNDSIVKTEDGIGTVIGSNPLAGTVRVVLKDSNDSAPKQYHRDQVTVIGKEKRNNGQKDGEKEE